MPELISWFSEVRRKPRIYLNHILLLLSHLSCVWFLCNPVDGSPSGSPVPGILQGRTRVGWHFLSNAWKWKGKVKSLGRVWPSASPWTAAYQAPPSMGFSGKSTGVGCCLFTIIWGYLKTIGNLNIGNGRGPVHLSQGKWTLTLCVFIKSCPECFWEIRMIPIEARCHDVPGLSLFFWDGSTRTCSVNGQFK